MATKKDLLEAQNFSKARLLSAFIGGAPGGKELEPAKPLRAVFAGVALTIMVILAGIFIGLMQPKLPSGWENNRLIVAGDTGARYISVEGTLHPVINTVSARMLIPEGEFEVVSVDQSALEGVPLGSTVGILGAPDTLPRASDLDGSGWRSCSTESGTSVRIGGQSQAAAPADGGIVVERDGETFVISDGTSYLVPDDVRTSVLRAVGLDTAQPIQVRGEWLALFTRGADLAPINLAAAGSATGTDLTAGTIIHPTGSPESDRYLLTEAGELAPLSELAYRLYLLGSGSGALGEAVDLSPAEIASLPTAAAVADRSWPAAQLTPLQLEIPCATLAGERLDQRTVLALEEREAPDAPDAELGEVQVSVAEDGGALVRGGSDGTLTLITSVGTSYAVPGDARSGATKLGYAASDIAVVPAAWIDLLPAGPELTEDSAGANPSTSDASL